MYLKISDNLFMLKRVLEKFYELNLHLYLLFTDFKQAYEANLYEILKDFGIPKKLVNPIKMMFQDSK
jgi:hypothetical protein